MMNSIFRRSGTGSVSPNLTDASSALTSSSSNDYFQTLTSKNKTIMELEAKLATKDKEIARLTRENVQLRTKLQLVTVQREREKEHLKKRLSMPGAAPRMNSSSYSSNSIKTRPRNQTAGARLHSERKLSLSIRESAVLKILSKQVSISAAVQSDGYDSGFESEEKVSHFPGLGLILSTEPTDAEPRDPNLHHNIHGVPRLAGVGSNGSTGSRGSRGGRMSLRNHGGVSSFTRMSAEEMVRFFAQDYYGSDAHLVSVFEPKYEIKIRYCDWTASGKCCRSIEKYLTSCVLPYYANTHTATSVTGKQTTLYRNEARRIVLTSDGVGGDESRDVCLFVGNGVTGAIYKLAHILMHQEQFAPEGTVVMVGIYEHNSNILIWKELGIEVVVIPEYPAHGKKASEQYGLNLEVLEQKLQWYRSGTNLKKFNLVIGSFSACSNVSGIVEKHDVITRLLHKYGALSFWDYATGGPYLDMKFTDPRDDALSKDAVFLSTHKFLGGPGAPGLLIVKKNLCANRVPVVPGGGTVLWAFGAKDEEYEYHESITEREEGGTPNIVGSIRAALTMMLKDKIGVETIEKIEHEYIKTFWTTFENEISTGVLKVIGNMKCPRLPIVSFNVTYKNKFLHYNYVAALLNDLFGINGRGGCSCAGMYGYTMLKEQVTIDIDYMMKQLEKENELARFGYFRINFHYTLSKDEYNFILRCVKYVCEHGWKFMALYDIDIESGLFVHRSQMKGSLNGEGNVFASLRDINFETPEQSRKCGPRSGKKLKRLKGFDAMFDFADNILKNMKGYMPTKQEISKERETGDDRRFYWLPSELYGDILKMATTHE